MASPKEDLKNEADMLDQEFCEFFNTLVVSLHGRGGGSHYGTKVH